MGRSDAEQTWFVGGASRSGSTLLAGLIAAATSGINVGELHLLWRSFEMRRDCTCGEVLDRCPFWSQVATRVLRARDIGTWSEAARIEAGEPRQRRIVVRGWKAAVPFDAAALRVETERAIREVSGAPVIVDSSKAAGSAVVALGETILLNVVHLVRDPRAVAYSMSQVKADPSTGAWLPRSGAAESALKWLTSNAAFERLAASDRARRVHRLRYEDFVKDPAATLIPLLGPGHPLPSEARSSRGEHAVAGNPWRYEPARPVVLDTRWESCMPATRQRLVTVLTLPMLVRYGYGGDPGRPVSFPR